MWSSAIVAFILTATSVQGLVVPRDGATLTKDVETIQDKLATVNTTVTGFKGSLLGTLTALKVLAQSADLNRAIGKAASDADKSEDLDEDESAAVAGAVLELADDVYGVLDNIVAKKPEFDKALLGVASGAFLVEDTLNMLQKSTNSFGDALVPKLTDDFAAIAPIVLGEINDHFDEAIAVYK